MPHTQKLTYPSWHISSQLSPWTAQEEGRQSNSHHLVVGATPPDSYPPHPVLWCPALHFSQQEFTKQDPTQVLRQSCEVGASLVLIALTLHIQTCCPSAESKAQPSEVVSHPGNSKLWTCVSISVSWGFSPIWTLNSSPKFPQNQT